MISSVFLSGRLGDVINDKMRYVEVDRPVPESGKFITDSYIIKSQTFESGPFMKEPKGSYICLKGRLEKDPSLGLIIVVEIDEMYRFGNNVTRI